MFCSSCGNLLRENFKFCVRCGVQVSSTVNTSSNLGSNAVSSESQISTANRPPTLNAFMYRSNRSLNIPPPGQPPGHLNFWNFYYQIPHPRDKIVDQKPHHLWWLCDQMPPPPGLKFKKCIDFSFLCTSQNRTAMQRFTVIFYFRTRLEFSHSELFLSQYLL